MRCGAALTVLVALAGCFDYEERLSLSPTGAVEAVLRYDLPPFMHPLSERGLLFPHATTDLTRRYPQARPLVDKKGALLGFALSETSPVSLDTPFVTRRYTRDPFGYYRFTLRITPPAGFADEVSSAVRRHLQRIPFLSAPKSAAVRADVLARMGPSFTVTFAAPITASNGVIRGATVAWKIPLERFLHDEVIVLTAAGRLTWWQRLRSRLPL